MNTNRLLIGLVIALVVAFLLSSFVYKQFQKASIVAPTSSQTLGRCCGASAARNPTECI